MATERTRMIERAALATVILMVAASMVVAVLGHRGLGFLLFLAAVTPLPPFVAVRAQRWVQRRRAAGGASKRKRSCAEETGV